jgi:protease-4
MATSKKDKINRNKIPALIIGILFAVLAIAGIIWLLGNTLDSVRKTDSLSSAQVALIPIKGEIGAGGGLFSESIKPDDVIKLIRKADTDAFIKALIFEIDSPGGSVVATREIADAVRETSKPSVAWLRESAASGGYWIASAADRIVADPATITGSIGVSAGYLEFSGLMKKYGVGYERLVSGEYKDTGSPMRQMTESEKILMQGKLDAIKAMFVSAIARNRNLSEEYVQTLATGEIFLGQEAYRKGLVDILGGKTDALREAERLANLKSSKLMEYKVKKGFLESLSGGVEAFSYWAGRGIGDALGLKSENKIQLS